MRVIVCGGRRYASADTVYRVLDEMRPSVVVHGGCTGADSSAGLWARVTGAVEEVHSADWRAHGKAAGPIRNRRMASLGADSLVAFPGGSGTDNMIAECRKAGIPVLLVDSDGEVVPMQ